MFVLYQQGHLNLYQLYIMCTIISIIHNLAFMVKHCISAFTVTSYCHNILPIIELSVPLLQLKLWINPV